MDETSLKDDIVAALDKRLESFKDELKTGLKTELKTELRAEIRTDLQAELELFRGEMNTRFDRVDESIHDMKQDVGRLEIMIDEVDDKFSLVTEGQDMIVEILETRVARIEDALGIERAVV